MKKSVLMIAIGICVAVAMMIPISAFDYTEVGGYYEVSSPNNDEVLRGEAGEATVKWDVPLLLQAPTIDGVIMDAEYAPFENYEEYLSLTATTNYGIGGIEELYEKTKDGIFDAYWGWDGQYLYLAFDVECVNGYFCTPDQDVMLFAYNCLQIGLSDVDAAGRDSSYLEMGFGYDNKYDKNLTFTWCGLYQSRREDFAGSYDEATQRVTYELRIDLMQALGWERYPEPGDQCNYAFVLEISGDEDVNKMANILFCHGIGGQYSMKRNEYFARITFSDQVYDQQDTTEIETTAPADETLTEEITTVPPEIQTFPPETTPSIELPEETIMPDTNAEQLPTQKDDVLFDGGLIQELWEQVDWQGCTSVSCIGVVPLIIVFGAVFIKKKQD